MIEDKFTVQKTDNKDSQPCATLTCKSCDCTFDVDTSYVFPINCRHQLGEAVTITCPKCGASGTTTKLDAKIRVLEVAQAKLQSYIDREALQFSKLPFKGVGDMDLNKLQTDLECNCGKRFHLDVKNRVNIEKNEDGYIVTCPHCGTKDVVQQGDLMRRVETVMTAMQLEYISSALAALRKEKEDAGH